MTTTFKTLMVCGALLGALATTGCGSDDTTRRETQASRAEATSAGGERSEARSSQDIDVDVDEHTDEGHPDPDAVVTAGQPEEPTAADQSERADDLEITRHIRRAVVSYDGLSMSARNVVIVTRNGVVTLRGTVDTPNERVVVTQLARDATGVVRVEDQLEVAN